MTPSATFPISRFAVVFRSMSKKATDLKLKKNVFLAIDLLWAMSSKGLTANFNRSRYRSFEWFISHRKRPVVLSVVREVAQLTRALKAGLFGVPLRPDYSKSDYSKYIGSKCIGDPLVYILKCFKLYLLLLLYYISVKFFFSSSQTKNECSWI